MKKVQSDIEILLVPLGILFVVIVLMIFSAKIIVDKVSSLNQVLSDNQKTENMLKLKLSSLQKVNPEVSTQSETSILALPGSNSVLDAVSQIQTQANELQLIISNLDSESGAPLKGSTINSTDLTFNADGSFQGLATFIDKIRNSTPITIFDTIKINSQNTGGGSIYRLSATLTSYWAPLPKTIPAITEPIEELTPDEKKILAQVSALHQLVNVNITNSGAPSSSSVGVGKTNPFQ